MTTSQACSWTDAEHGFREDAAFVADEMFTVTTLPLTEPVGLLLICPPLADDLVRNYRREVILARRLAARGIATQRFHHRSTGNSLGDAAVMGWSALLDDAREALQAVGSAVERLPLALFGTRFGALVAMALASEHGGAPVALWDPVPGVADYVRDVVRIERLVALSDRTPSPAPAAGGGRDSALALRRLPPLLVEERDDHSIATIVTQPRSAIMVATLVDQREGRTTEKAIDALRATGATVETKEFRKEGSWWPVAGLKVRDTDATWHVVDATTEWLVEALEHAR